MSLIMDEHGSDCWLIKEGQGGDMKIITKQNAVPERLYNNKQFYQGEWKQHQKKGEKKKKKEER